MTCSVLYIVITIAIAVAAAAAFVVVVIDGLLEQATRGQRPMRRRWRIRWRVEVFQVKDAFRVGMGRHGFFCSGFLPTQFE
jgi:hypothetical protein